MKLIKLTEKHEEKWKSFIKDFRDYGESIKPSAVIGKSEVFKDYLEECIQKSKGINLDEHQVPSDIYYLVEEDSTYLIGAINIRHYLSRYLLMYGGNIGYAIRPAERNKGYATKMLELALEECKKINLDSVLITCSISNEGSAKVIKNNGGILKNQIIEGDDIIQRYWIEL